MGGTFTSWAALKKALQKEMREAMEETVRDAHNDTVKNNLAFYGGGTPIKYKRTGAFGAAVKTPTISGGGDYLEAEVGRDGDYTYSTGSNPTGETVFGWAEYGEAGIVGLTGTWNTTEAEIWDDLQTNFSRHFS